MRYYPAQGIGHTSQRLRTAISVKFSLYRTHLKSILRKSQKPGFSRYFCLPTQKFVETRFLTPGVNLRNRVDLGISRHLTQKLKDLKWVVYINTVELRFFDEFLQSTILRQGQLGLRIYEIIDCIKAGTRPIQVNRIASYYGQYSIHDPLNFKILCRRVRRTQHYHGIEANLESAQGERV